MTRKSNNNSNINLHLLNIHQIMLYFKMKIKCNNSMNKITLVVLKINPSKNNINTLINFQIIIITVIIKTTLIISIIYS